MSAGRNVIHQTMTGLNAGIVQFEVVLSGTAADAQSDMSNSSPEGENKGME